ncbi:MAG: hypothetical protein AB2693_27390 [Candidatus Thiodiazotropha sp.]
MLIFDFSVYIIKWFSELNDSNNYFYSLLNQCFHLQNTSGKRKHDNMTTSDEPPTKKPNLGRLKLVRDGNKWKRIYTNGCNVGLPDCRPVNEMPPVTSGGKSDCSSLVIGSDEPTSCSTALGAAGFDPLLPIASGEPTSCSTALGAAGFDPLLPIASGGKSDCSSFVPSASLQTEFVPNERNLFEYLASDSTFSMMDLSDLLGV